MVTLVWSSETVFRSFQRRSGQGQVKKGQILTQLKALCGPWIAPRIPSVTQKRAYCIGPNQTLHIYTWLFRVLCQTKIKTIESEGSQWEEIKSKHMHTHTRTHQHTRTHTHVRIRSRFVKKYCFTARLNTVIPSPLISSGKTFSSVAAR